jgi:glutaredoxin 3
MSMAEVTVYTTPTCPWCQKLKGFLHDEGIPFTEINVAEDPDKAREMMDKTGQRGVPVTTVGDQVVIGYDPEALRELIQ